MYRDDPEGAVEDALGAIGKDPLNAFITLDAEGARARAARLASQGPRARPLFGAIVSVKDNIAVQGLRLTSGSKHLEKYVAPYDATVVERLEAAGAIVIGKSNLDEFGAGSSGENSAFGPTRNPVDRTRVPGGSSSGSAAAVAAGWSDLAIGSDTGGSVRCPASFCGVVGFKPSYGLVSRYGLVDLAMSLESPAPLARNVTDCARLLAAIAGPDARDATTHAPGLAGLLGADGTLDPADPKTLRIGLVREFHEGLTGEVARAASDAVDALRNAGAQIREVSVPEVKHALPTYYLLNYSEFASAMQKLDGFRYGTPAEGPTVADAQTHARSTLGAEVKRRILLGTFATSREQRARWYQSAVSAKARVAESFRRALTGVDLLVGPTMPFTAFKLGERVSDPVSMYAADVLTVSANLAGLPAGSVPVRAPGLPVGLQILGAPGADARVLRGMRLAEVLCGEVAP